MAEGDEEKVEEKKGSLVKLIIIVVAGLILLGGGLFIGKMFFTTSESEKEEAKESTKEEKKKDELGPIHTMDVFIVNLADKSGDKYLKVTIELELSSEEIKQEIIIRTPQFRDAVLMLLSSKKYEDINNIAGKNVLRNEIMVRLNRFLTTGTIKKIYFVEFVVQ